MTTRQGMDEIGASVWHAFMATDIEGSMDKWRRFRDAMGLALLQHSRIIEDAVSRAGGTVFKGEGDAVFARFDDVASAVTAAVDLERGLHAYPWHEVAEGFPVLRVRVGIHCGEAQLHGDDSQGVVVGELTRLTDAANGGQIFLSGAAAKELGSLRPRSCRLRDHGIYRLPDFDHPQRIKQVVATRFPDLDQPPRSPSGSQGSHLVVLVDEGQAIEEPPDLAAERLEAVLRGDEAAPELSARSLRAIAGQQAKTLRAYRLGRIAHRLDPRYGLESHFVPRRLELLATDGLLDRAGPLLYGHLELLERLAARCAVVLSEAGGGASTLLRRLELDLHLQAVRTDSPTLVVPMRLSRLDMELEDSHAVHDWLATSWARRNPHLPSLEILARDFKLVYLLDGLDQMHHASTAELRRKFGAWRRALEEGAERDPHARFVLTCRERNYVVSLSTEAHAVARTRLLPLGEAEARELMSRRAPAQSTEGWMSLERHGPRALMRSPFFLAAWCDRQRRVGSISGSPSAWIESAIQDALVREVRRDTPAIVSSELLSERDLAALAHMEATPHAVRMPQHSPLFSKLEDLAILTLQSNAESMRRDGTLSFAACAETLGPARAEHVVHAAAELGLVHDDIHGGRVAFVDIAVRDYLAGRAIASDGRLAIEGEVWRTDEYTPTLDEAILALEPGGRIVTSRIDPRARAHRFAASVSADGDGFTRRLARTRLVDAADAIAVEGAEVSEALREDIRQRLVDRIQNPATDLRARIEAGCALGRLGLPTLSLHESPYGRYLWPELRKIVGGRYPMGGGAQSAAAWSKPAHEVTIDTLHMALHPVTHAEWQCFMDVAGYEDRRWWHGDSAAAWQRGETTAFAQRERDRTWWRRMQAEPRLLSRLYSQGQAPQATFDLWARLMRMSEEAFEEYLRNRHPNELLRAPDYWWNETYRQDAQPVIGISWFEARAYCRWLSAASGRGVDLPTEAEWEAAARGQTGHDYPWGATPEIANANVAELRIGRPSPVGVFPSGRSPLGILDLVGNVQEWTSSAWGIAGDRPDFGYPYDPHDGREDDGPDALRRVFRGGNWAQPLAKSAAWQRDADPPGLRGTVIGMRIVVRD